MKKLVLKIFSKKINPFWQKVVLTIIVAIAGLVLVYGSVISLDPDFGWHLKEGQLILESGFPKSDPFSYTMPSFEYADHEWGLNVLFWQGYNHIGRVGLSLVLAIIAGLALFLVVRSNSKFTPIFKYSLILLGLGAMMPFFGIRPQVVSWLLLSVLIFLFFNEKFWNKFKYFLPLLFGLWANLHGSFVLGLATLSVFVVIKSIDQRKFEIVNYLIVLISFLASLVNPYGIGVWKEAAMTILDSKLKWTINEWQPSLFVFNISYLFLFCLCISFFVKFHKKMDLKDKGLLISFSLGSLSSLRNIPLFILFSIPLIIKLSNIFYAQVSRNGSSLKRFQIALNIFFVISVALFVSSSVFYIRDARVLSESNFYPQRAVEFLNLNKPEGEIFSSYGWGGYLIWKLPNQKTFVDGRMPSWRRDASPAQESISAMDDYLDITSGKLSFESVQKKYNIDTVVWPINKSSKYKNLGTAIARLIGIKNTDFDFEGEVLNSGFKVVYQDSNTKIYRRD